MDSFAGKVAFITGGASGIGFGIAQALADAGARIVIADINAPAAQAAAAQLREAIGIRLDVTQPAEWDAARAAAIDRFGPVHILCNNAGVTGSMRTPLEELTIEGWRWTRSVILDGVVNGLTAFLPHLLGHGEGGHVVNTGSMASLIATPGTGDYTAAKFGVAGLSETLRIELEGSGVGVSILCPGHTRTGLIANSRGQMPEREAAKVDALFGAANMTAAMDSGLDPRVTGEMVRRGIAEGRFHILTHPEYAAQVAERYDAIAADFAWAKACRESL